MRQISIPPTFLDRLPLWLQAVLRDRFVWAMLIVALFVNLGLFAFLLLVEPQLPTFVPLHFDPAGQVDRVDAKNGIFTLPQIGLLVILLNIAVAALFYKREPLAAYLVCGVGIAVQFLLWFAAVSIVRVALA
jgi:hypothetical protein